MMSWGFSLREFLLGAREDSATTLEITTPIAIVSKAALPSVVTQSVAFLIVMASAGNTKGGSITVPLTSCLTGLESAV